MKIKNWFGTIALNCIVILSTLAQTQERIYLWPDAVPGESEEKHEPKLSEEVNEGVLLWTDVTNPAMTVYRPEASKANGSAVVICPGGGYFILAMDLEGYEIGEWLVSLGYTAFVLEYRVPNKRAGALMDAQRALRIVRANAAKYDLNSNKIGILGFSAGGSLSARISTRYNEELYAQVDSQDQVSARPDFTVLIYPAYLDEGENRSLTPEIKLDKNSPPMFLFATADDPYANSLIAMTQALRDAKLPVESHLLAEGGHGYGLRNGHKAAETWPKLLENWLEYELKK